MNLKAVLIPAEHGASVMLAESLVAGLIIGGSPLGFIVAIAWLLIFIMSQPLKIVVKDWLRSTFTPRTRLSVYCVLFLGSLAAATMAVGVVISAGRLLWVIAAVAIPGAVHLWATLKGGKKELVAELFGALSLGGAAASVAVVAGMPTVKAFILWSVLAVRAGTSVFFVRARLRRIRKEFFDWAEVLSVHLLALAALSFFVAQHVVKPIVLWGGLLLALRLVVLKDHRPASAKAVGMQEVAVGVFYVLCVVWAF